MALVRLVRGVQRRVQQRVVGAVVGLPGPVDYIKGDVLMLPNLPDWEGQVTVQLLARAWNLPVLLANDADLAALGEHRYGAGQGTSDMLYVTSSTGVGAGVVLGGKLLRARLSLAEVGHTIIDSSTGGTVESLGSGTALARIAAEDAASVSSRAKAGDAEALGYFSSVAKDFAVGVFNLVHCFSPETVVIGGGMAGAGDMLLSPIRAMLERCGRNCPASRATVVLALGGDDAGLKGAAAYWSDHHEV